MSRTHWKTELQDINSLTDNERLLHSKYLKYSIIPTKKPSHKKTSIQPTNLVQPDATILFKVNLISIQQEVTCDDIEIQRRSVIRLF